MNEVGYHGTCLKYRYDIETNGLDPIKSKYRADHWLGQGVYFFDDYDKALWWASTTSLQNDNCGGIVFESIIEAPPRSFLPSSSTAFLRIYTRMRSRLAWYPTKS